MNTALKTRIYQQLRLFDKIEDNLSGKLKEENIAYLFFIHLISGHWTIKAKWFELF